MGMIQMSRLGNYGQWGNQVIEYAFVRDYARRFGHDYEVPEWGGQYLYGFDDPPMTRQLPTKVESTNDKNGGGAFGVPLPPYGDEHRDKDFKGWAQYHTTYYAPARGFLLQLYGTPAEPQFSRVQSALCQLRERGKTVIGLHFRRGDSGRLIFFFTPILWALKWLHENWRRFPDPVLYMATEEDDLLAPFAWYRPVTASQLGIEWNTQPYPGYTYPFDPKPERARQMDFFPDWYILQHTDVLLASDSTFSVTAGWLSPTVQEFWKPRLSFCGFEQLDPWDMHFSPREMVDDYRIPGTFVNENKHFGDVWKTWKNKAEAEPENPDDWKPYMRPLK